MKKFLSILLIAYVIVLAINIAGNYSYYAAGNDWKFSVLFSLIMTTIGSAGGYSFKFLFKRLNWLERPMLNLVISILSFAVYGVVLMLLAMKGMVWIFHNPEPPLSDYISSTVSSVLISIVIGLIVSGSIFLKHLKISTEDNQRLKQEMIQSQYETLKNQVNPHFLFNSLNTLTVMILTQPDIAVQFVEQMAKVFRYSLQYGNENTIDIGTELKVVRSFLFLNEQRYNGKLLISINLDDVVLQRKIITQSLLMLVENAIKHNEISHDNPLKIDISSDGVYLVVSNTLQIKRLPEQSTKMGIENIRKRYALTTDIPLLISDTDNCFTVKIPILD